MQPTSSQTTPTLHGTPVGAQPVQPAQQGAYQVHIRTNLPTGPALAQQQQQNSQNAAIGQVWQNAQINNSH